MYLHKNKKNKLLLLLRWGKFKVRDRFGGMGSFKGGFRCNGWVNHVTINVIACRYSYKYNYYVKTCMHTISVLYKMISLNFSAS